MRLRRVTIVVLVVLLLGALVVPAALAKNADKTVPLKGNFAGVGLLVGDTFSGNFTHLGNFDGVIEAGLTATWTSASGKDTVTNQTTGFTLTGGGPLVFTYEQTIEITGGTGRFVCAFGEGVITGTIDFGSGAYDGYLDGMISQPNKKAVC